MLPKVQYAACWSPCVLVLAMPAARHAVSVTSCVARRGRTVVLLHNMQAMTALAAGPPSSLIVAVIYIHENTCVRACIDVCSWHAYPYHAQARYRWFADWDLVQPW